MEGTPALQEAVRRFLEARALAGSSPATCRTYYALLKPLREDGRLLAELTPADCRQLLLARLQKSDATAATFYDALHAFIVWCLEMRWLREDLLLGVHRPRIREQRQPVLTLEQFRAIRVVCDDELVLRLLSEGLRASELLGIRWTDVRPDRIVIMGKGSRPRAILLTAEVRALLAQRRDACIGHRLRPRVFDLTYKALYYRVRCWGKAAGVPWLHPHSFRHLAASQWYRETGDMDAMRVLFGWEPGSRMPHRYARSALEDTALAKAREVGLASRLFGEWAVSRLLD